MKTPPPPGDELPAALVRLLRCPETGSPLHPATPEELARIRERAGTPVTGALVNEAGTLAYPVRDGFPVLVRDEAVPLP